jgi:hypothetical protein
MGATTDIQVNYSGISGECLETARELTVPLAPVKGGNAATSDVPHPAILLQLLARACHSQKQKQQPSGPRRKDEGPAWHFALVIKA